MKKSLLQGFDLPARQPKASVSLAPQRGYPASRPAQEQAPRASLAPAAAPIPESPPKRKAGRPRLNPDRPLTPAEKAARYRKKRQAISKRARAGMAYAPALSNIDLCHAVAMMLNRPADLELRQLGSPLVKELQRRLKNL